jgi:hypothetical protein
MHTPRTILYTVKSVQDELNNLDLTNFELAAFAIRTGISKIMCVLPALDSNETAATHFRELMCLYQESRNVANENEAMMLIQQVQAITDAIGESVKLFAV